MSAVRPLLGPGPGGSHLIVAGLDHQQGRLVLLDAHVERGQRTAVLLGGVQQDRLVHGDAHRQPRPQREQL